MIARMVPALPYAILDFPHLGVPLREQHFVGLLKCFPPSHSLGLVRLLFLADEGAAERTVRHRLRGPVIIHLRLVYVVTHSTVSANCWLPPVPPAPGGGTGPPRPVV